MAYTDEQKQTALATYAACRNDAEHAAKFCREHYGMKITGQTIRQWAKGVHIHPSVKEKVDYKKEELSVIYEAVTRECLQAVGGKIEEASLKDLMISAATATDKMRLLRGEATTITQQNMSDDERAKRLDEILNEARKRKEGYAGK